MRLVFDTNTKEKDMTDRLNALTAVLTELIGLRDRTKELYATLTEEDVELLLGSLSAAIRDCEHLLGVEYAGHLLAGA
tara:strand:+ start:1190 stop:1423 length:234 start_codon:yes stop_codon:yes gene_type:complete